MKNLLKVSILAVLLAQSAHAAEFRVLAYGEHVGTEIVYRYTLVNNGLGMPRKLTIGTKDTGNTHFDASDRAGPGVYNSAPPEFHETLTRWPTGLSFIPNASIGYPDIPVLDPASVGVPALPSGWQAKAIAGPEISIHSIAWVAPVTYPIEEYSGIRQGPPTGADAGQTLSGFSVRVPQAKPVLTAQHRLAFARSCRSGELICDGQLLPVTTGHVAGDFLVQVWRGYDKTLSLYQHIFGTIEKQDTLPPVLSVTLTPNTLRPNEKLVSIAATITVKDDYDGMPAIVLESITANEPLEKEDIKDAKIGTDDRQFKLKAEREGRNKAGRIYTVTYSATDGTGNKATASATVTVPHDERKKDD